MMNAYNERLAVLAEDLINTHDLFLEEPEHLQTPADLEAFLRIHNPLVNQNPTEHDLYAVRRLRDQLRAIWISPDTTKSLQQLNALLAKASVQLHVNEGQQGDEIALRIEPDHTSSLDERLSVSCAMGIVGVIQQHGTERMRACESSPCRDVFIDTSRNKSRRFCSDRCANRYNVAAFRERNKN
jgi:predicted RNA-binding Zn ribbon-like protein